MAYKIRFHLAQGPHFMHWQVKAPTGEVTYHDPETTSLFMVGAKLRNQPATANRIHAGADKSVCAWIDATEVLTSKPMAHRGPQKAFYNPRIAPHWRNAEGDNIDGARFDALYTHGRQIH